MISHIGYKTEIIPVDVKPNLFHLLTSILKDELNLAEIRVNSKEHLV